MFLYFRIHKTAGVFSKKFVSRKDRTRAMFYFTLQGRGVKTDGSYTNFDDTSIFLCYCTAIIANEHHQSEYSILSTVLIYHRLGNMIYIYVQFIIFSVLYVYSRLGQFVSKI